MRSLEDPQRGAGAFGPKVDFLKIVIFGALRATIEKALKSAKGRIRHGQPMHPRADLHSSVVPGTKPARGDYSKNYSPSMRRKHADPNPGPGKSRKVQNGGICPPPPSPASHWRRPVEIQEMLGFLKCFIISGECKDFSGFLRMSQDFSGFLWISQDFSGFLGFP